MQDKELAKKIILEIIRQAGGVFDNKTNLYKAFYHAHLKFAADNPGLLSTWPIVRMPRGPGIHRSDKLIGELYAGGWLKIHELRGTDWMGFRFVLTDKAKKTVSDLSPEAIAAIQYGVGKVVGKTADQVSHDSHIQSRAWHTEPNGKELAIYTDLLSDEEYADLEKRTDSALQAFRDEFSDTKR